MKTRSWRAPLSGLLVLLIAIAAIWHVGHGAWIYGKAEAAQYLLHRAWERTQAESRPVRPWPWADTWPVAKLTVPRLGIDHIVLANASARTLAFGPALYGTAHFTGAAAGPTDTALGMPDTLVVTGHRDTHFRFLQALRQSDLFTLTSPSGARRSYRVATTQVMDSRQGLVAPPREVGQVLLVTCYPFDALAPGGPLRYVVIAEEIAEHAAGSPTASDLPI